LLLDRVTALIFLDGKKQDLIVRIVTFTERNKGFTLSVIYLYCFEVKQAIEGEQ